MERFLFWLTSFLPCRLINDGNSIYLERYYLFTLFGWRFYLHRFIGSDPDRGLHDHPWSKAYSLILSGWYWEETRCGTRQVRWFNSLTGDTFHRVVLPDDPTWSDGFNEQPCWTLFFHRAGNVKPWGFWREVDQSAFPDAAYFEPYTYQREGSQQEWWKTAKPGREVRHG